MYKSVNIKIPHQGNDFFPTGCTKYLKLADQSVNRYFKYDYYQATYDDDERWQY